MLDIMRRNSNSWLIVLLFAVITFVFAINFGPWVGNLGKESRYPAEVNGQAITMQEFQMAYAAQIRTLQTYQPDFNPEGALQETLKQTVLNRLIGKALLVQLAQKEEFTVSDSELAQFIRTQIFDKEKNLDRETYKRAIYSSYQMSENQFEAQLRNDLIVEKMTQIIQTVASLDNYVEFLKKSAEVKIF